MMKYRDRRYLTASSRLMCKGVNKMRMPMSDNEKAQAIADRLYHIAPSRQTVKVTADRIMANASPEEIAFYYAKLCEKE